MTLPEIPSTFLTQADREKSLLPFKRGSRTAAASAHLAKEGPGAPVAAEVGQEGGSAPEAPVKAPSPLPQRRRPSSALGPAGGLDRFPAAEPGVRGRLGSPPPPPSCRPRLWAGARCRNRRFRHAWRRGAAGRVGTGGGRRGRGRPAGAPPETSRAPLIAGETRGGAGRFSPSPTRHLPGSRAGCG